VAGVSHRRLCYVKKSEHNGWSLEIASGSQFMIKSSKFQHLLSIRTTFLYRVSLPSVRGNVKCV